MKNLLNLLLFAFVVLFTACDTNDADDPEPSTFTVTIENVSTAQPFTSSGVFNTPKGDDGPGPITPGKEYEFTVKAEKSSKLSFVTMLAATNDLFYAPDGGGIPLYNQDGSAVSGDVTSQVYLWDAGTEVNEEPGVGPNTVGNQSGPDTGEDENGTVQKIGDISNDMFDYPDVSEVIKVTIEHLGGAEFRISIEDVSTATTLETSEGDRPAPMSPGVWVVHAGDNPLFTEGEADRGQGIEGIAEDGNPSNLGMYTSGNSGITFPLSPGAWAVHPEGEMPIYIEGMADLGEGLEAIAEDGSPSILAQTLMGKPTVESSGAMNTTVGSTEPGPVLPGSMYEVSFDAIPGDRLTFATMLVKTNDLFFGPSEEGIALFDTNEAPINGNVTSQVYLWDAGTEVNEEPAYGSNVVTNQAGPDTGIDENGTVRQITDVNDGFTYPSTASIIRVTITAN